MPAAALPLVKPITLNSRTALKISAAMYLNATWFLLGHEFGHIIEKHHSYSCDSEVNHAMEFTADEWGLRLSLRYTDRVLREAFPPTTAENADLLSFSMLGPFAVLAAVGAMSQSGHSSNSHPPTEKRLRRLEEKSSDIAVEVLGDITSPVVGQILELGQLLFDQMIVLGTIMHSLGADLVQDGGPGDSA